MAAKARILIVEDEPGLLEVIALNLQGSGYETFTAADGLEALSKFEEKKPDLVTLDLNIPSISGFRLIRLFKQKDKSVPVVVITAYSFEEAEEVVTAGADDFITKPIEFPLLLSKIERALAKKPGH